MCMRLWGADSTLRGTYSFEGGPVFCRSANKEMKHMKKTVLIFLALFALGLSAQLMAQPAQVSAPVPDTAQFLATLSAGQAQTPGDVMPAPSLRTSCTSSSQCPTGQLCCNLCGTPPEGGGSCFACTTPFRGRCPLVE